MNTDVASIPIEYTQQKYKFRIGSTPQAEFSVLTDGGAGISLDGNGNTRFHTNKTSIEVVGEKIDVPPGSCVPAKIIRAKNGDIVLDAEQGDIYLKARNITIVATDALGGEIILNSNKIVQINAPVVNTQAENVTTAASGTLNLGAGALTKNGEIINEDTTATDEEKASWKNTFRVKEI